MYLLWESAGASVTPLFKPSTDAAYLPFSILCFLASWYRACKQKAYVAGRASPIRKAAQASIWGSPFKGYPLWEAAQESCLSQCFLRRPLSVDMFQKALEHLREFGKIVLVYLRAHLVGAWLGCPKNRPHWELLAVTNIFS